MKRHDTPRSIRSTAPGIDLGAGVPDVQWNHTPRIITSVRSFRPACAKDQRRLAQQLVSQHVSSPGNACLAAIAANRAPLLCHLAQLRHYPHENHQAFR